MQIKDLMQAMAQRQGWGEQQPEEDGSFRLVFDDELEIRCFQVGNRLYLQSELGWQPPADSREARESLAGMLRVSFARTLQQDQSLCLNPQSGRLELYRVVPVELADAFFFEEALEDFANDLEFWQGQTSKNAQTRTMRMPPMNMMFP